MWSVLFLKGGGVTNEKIPFMTDNQSQNTAWTSSSVCAPVWTLAFCQLVLTKMFLVSFSGQSEDVSDLSAVQVSMRAKYFQSLFDHVSECIVLTILVSTGGNAGMAAAYSARQLGVPATIVVPNVTPNPTVERLKDEGATVVIHGKVRSLGVILYINHIYLFFKIYISNLLFKVMQILSYIFIIYIYIFFRLWMKALNMDSSLWRTTRAGYSYPPLMTPSYGESQSALHDWHYCAQFNAEETVSSRDEACVWLILTLILSSTVIQTWNSCCGCGWMMCYVRRYVIRAYFEGLSDNLLTF